MGPRVSGARNAVVLGVAALVLCAASAHAQTAANVAVVINEASPESVQVGEYYVKARNVPAANVIRLRTSTAETISFAEYSNAIEVPITNALLDGGLQDRILYIVLTKGMPLRILGTVGRTGTSSSVDSQLALLYRKMSTRTTPLAGPAENPYYLGAAAVKDAKPFTHRDYDIYLVTRLDGFSVQDVHGLIDRALRPSATGRILLDRRSEPASATGDMWLVEASARLKDAGFGEHTVLAETVDPDGAGEPLLGYYSWGSNDPSNRRRRLGLRFVPGAIAATLAGTDARTMQPPPDNWVPSADLMNRNKWFQGAPHSLIGDLIADGVTGVSGTVNEPLLASAVRPQILFAAYVSGFNLAEAFYLSLPHLSWYSVVIGDPLCRPFEGHALTQEDIDPGVDARTGLPRLFSNRRIQALRERNRGADPDVLAMFIRGQLEYRAGKKDEARATLEDVNKRASDIVDAQALLATIYEEGNDYDRAIERYRRIVQLEPGNVIALNNLAYRLAVEKGLPLEALPLARRAAAVAPANPDVLDTLAWILHMRGEDKEALKYINEAVRRNPKSAIIRVHAATVSYAVGSYKAATAHLDEAVKLDAALADDKDVKELRANLQKHR